MEFKPWYYLQEVIDDNDYKLIQNNLANIYDPEKIKLINAEIEDLRKDPRKFRIKDVMDVVRKKYPANKEKTQKLDNMAQQYQRRPNVTQEEVETFKYFFDQDVPSESLDEMMNLLRDFLNRKLIDLKIISGKPELFKKDERGQLEKTETPDFTRFISVLHGIQGSLKKLGPSSQYYDPRTENNPANLVAQGDNIWVYKGSMPELCRIFGKGTIWCIASSSSTEHYYDYRLINGQTQYFIYDFNKAKNDPARYVNPGVAPPGQYSEWVDLRNKHKKDPQERNTSFGVNGYKSINEYKRYLASKGIDPSVFVADPIQDWERRLERYVNSKDFQGAKNDVESTKVWPSFLKLVKQITDEEFNSLTDNEKKMYVLRKWLTEYQREWAMNNFKQEYLSSLDDLEIANEKIANFILNNKRTLSNKLLLGVLLHLPDLSNAEETIGPKNLEKINKFDEEQFFLLIYASQDKEGMLDIILNHYKKELDDNNIYNILKYFPDLKAVESKLGEKNLSKINQIRDASLDGLSNDAQDQKNIWYILDKYTQGRLVHPL